MTDRSAPDAARQVLPGGVEVRIDGAVATISLNRPEVRNAQTFATWASLHQAATTLPGEVAVVLLRGVGPDFSAGLDLRMMRPAGDPRGRLEPAEGSLSELTGLERSEREQRIAVFQRGFSCWRELRPIVIAVVRGRAIGAGFQLALAADLRIAEAGASFAMAEVKLGLVPDLGGTHPLVRLLGYSRALQICLGGEPVEAADALRWGLVQDCVEPDELEAHLDALTRRLADLPVGLAAELKMLLRGAEHQDYAGQLAAERSAQAGLLDQSGSQTRRNGPARLDVAPPR